MSRQVKDEETRAQESPGRVRHMVADDGAHRAHRDQASKPVRPLGQRGRDDEDHPTRERSPGRLDEKGPKHKGVEVFRQEVEVRLKKLHFPPATSVDGMSK